MGDDKVIHSFQQRRQLAQALEQMAETETEAELLEQVRALVHTYPSELLLTTLVRNLDTTSSQLRGGLGHLATLLPTEETTRTLHKTAADRRLSPQTRLTAGLIAERFLGNPVSPALLSDLAGSNDVAFQSLLEAVEEGKRNRHVLLEYVLQMRELGQDIAFMVMDALDRLPAVDRPALLRIIAHDARLTVAQRAVERLIRLAEAAPSGEAEADAGILAAARVLHVLQFTLPPRLAEPIARTTRKLRFAGGGYAPPAAEGWRGLLSPADMGGNQTVWCFRGPEPETGADADKPGRKRKATGVLLGLVINARLGIVQAFGSESIAVEHLPQPQGVGQMTLVKTDTGENAVLLEAPFDFCRARILAALATGWQVEPKRDLPAEYQLYNDLIWQFAAPQPPEDLDAYFSETAQDAPGAGNLPPEELDYHAEQLLQHPAMSHWRVQNRMLHQLLRRARDPEAFGGASSEVSGVQDEGKAATHSSTSTAGESASTRPISPSAGAVIRMVLRELAARPETAHINEAILTGLQAQAAWLHLAGDMTAARHAWTLARALPKLDAAENPVLARMVAASIEPDIEA